MIKKNFLKWIAFLTLCFVATGCVAHYLIGKIEIDASNDPKYCELLEKIGTFTQDLFLVEIYEGDYTWVNNWYKVDCELGLPGKCSQIPKTVQEYEQNAEELSTRKEKAILGIVRSGTQFTLKKITRVHYPGYSTTYIYFLLLNGEFAGKIVNAHYLFFNNELDTKYVKLSGY